MTNAEIISTTKCQQTPQKCSINTSVTAQRTHRQYYIT